jgi:hypothetical protein
MIRSGYFEEVCPLGAIILESMGILEFSYCLYTSAVLSTGMCSVERLVSNIIESEGDIC